MGHLRVLKGDGRKVGLHLGFKLNFFKTVFQKGLFFPRGSGLARAAIGLGDIFPFGFKNFKRGFPSIKGAFNWGYSTQGRAHII